MQEGNADFYLGRLYDAVSGETVEQPLFYNPADLTTHGVVVGMTGSGKTGLCIGLLEEAALKGLPALMIDPKGDITNVLLHFPNLAAEDFLPWIGADVTRRTGKSVEAIAAETAERWRAGLARWDIAPGRIARLAESVQFAVYTPGSDAGLPVSILASLQAPDLAWNDHTELLREKIASTVTALLGLIGLKEADPLRSREHILLANIFEQAWSQGRDLDLRELILEVQSPPFDHLGALPVEQFYPERARAELVMQLNSILAAPSFQAWIQGDPLDIPRLLWTEDGRPRHTIFYIAHLSESERMFFVTLLLSALEAWMRTQAGATGLRALLYFDEIFGYLPPVSQPASKTVMLRLLKQARAYGLGLLLATQNPADIDYKALSNAGTWFIGKLATERDKQRLLDGLASAGPDGLDKTAYDDLISALGQRVFLLRNVHEGKPILFQTRWVMNYLAGPLTRAQIEPLNRLAGAGTVTPGVSPAPEIEAKAEVAVPPAALEVDARGAPDEPVALPEAETSQPERPQPPRGVPEYFLPVTLSAREALARFAPAFGESWAADGILYRPALFGQAHITFYNRKYDLDLSRRWAALVAEPGLAERLDWEYLAAGTLDPSVIALAPEEATEFMPLTGGLTDGRILRALRDDFVDWLYRNSQVIVRENRVLGLSAGPDTSREQFESQCRARATERAEAEVAKAGAPFDRKLERLGQRLQLAEKTLDEQESELSRRRNDEMLTHAKTLFSLFSKDRRAASRRKRKQSQNAQAGVEKIVQQVDTLRAEIAAVEQEKSAAMAEIREKWQAIARDYAEVSISPYKKDISLELFGIAWLPKHRVQGSTQMFEVPAHPLAAGAV